MSLVLEALKKADAERERERGAVPDLHARPVPLAPPPPAAGGRGPVLAWSVAGLALAAAAVFGWQALRRPAPADIAAAPATAPAPAQPPATGAIPAPASPAVAPPAPAPEPPPAPPPRPAPAPRATPPAPAPAPPPARAETPRAPAAARPVQPVSPPPAAPAAATRDRAQDNERPPTASRADERVHESQQSLPDEVRRAIPRLVMGGAMYSESAANRMLIVNGQLFRENDELSPGLVLEQIALKSAVLRYRNYRFRVSY